MYIFLDIDGVLNRKSDWKTNFQMNQECLANFDYFLSKIKNYNIKIILSSTWRFAADQKALEPLNKILKKYNLCINDTTIHSNKTRQEEIEYYIRRNTIKEYIIIDDDENLFPYSEKINLFLTDYNVGFTKNTAKEIIKFIKEAKYEH